MPRITIGSATHVGMRKAENEDAFGFFPPEEGRNHPKGILLVLADGMGGRRGGTLASQMAVDTVLETYYQTPSDSIRESLKTAFEKANAYVLARGAEDLDLEGMATTLTAVVLKNGHMFHAHVGDSRAYSIVSDSITPFTEDHSYVASLVKAGVIKPEDAEAHPQSNLLTRAIGLQEELLIDLPDKPQAIRKGQYILLCCDGLYKDVHDPDIFGVFRDFKEPDAICDRLIDMANENGGSDNITTLVARIDHIGLTAGLFSRLLHAAR